MRYTKRFMARTVRGKLVIVPDFVACEQKRVYASQQAFPVLDPISGRRMGYAKLRGDLYGLGHPGTGGMIVAIR